MGQDRLNALTVRFIKRKLLKLRISITELLIRKSEKKDELNYSTNEGEFSVVSLLLVSVKYFFRIIKLVLQNAFCPGVL
jgi:hypothetical protein